MSVTHEDAIAMYAKFCRARYGFNAYQKVKDRASQLSQVGDLAGEKVWNEVAAEIQKSAEFQKPVFA